MVSTSNINNYSLPLVVNVEKVGKGKQVRNSK